MLTARLLAAGFEDVALDARILMEGALGLDAASIDQRAQIGSAALEKLETFAARRLAGEPVWRILGEREFWGLPFRLSPATLEPRPDSETLIEAALAALKDRRNEPLAILDLGTGTGCLLIALLSEFRAARGVGVDLSDEACVTAMGNAALNGVGNRASILQGDWTRGLPQRFDLIVSNPPYIPTAEIATLSIGVREHDPLLALDGGDDGLACYRALATALPHALAPNGLAVIEIGAGQGPDVNTSARSCLPFDDTHRHLCEFAWMPSQKPLCTQASRSWCRQRRALGTSPTAKRCLRISPQTYGT
jgi:release factor glutamine methyltransferase